MQDDPLISGSKPELKSAYDAIVYPVLRPGAIGLGALYVFFGTAHWFLLPGKIRQPMTVIAFASAAVLFGFASRMARRPYPTRWAHPLAGGMAGIVLFNSLAHLYLTGEPRQTMNLVLLVIGVGCLFLSERWLMWVLAATFAGWFWVTWLLVHSAILSFFAFELFSAAVLGMVIHAARMRTYARLEELRSKDRQRTRELQAALNAAEHEIIERQRVEADLEKARQSLERSVQERTSELAEANQTLRGEILERRRAEAALRTSESNLVLAQRVGHVGSWELDLGTDRLHLSAEAARIFGFESATASLTPSTLLESIHSDDREIMQNKLNEAIRKALGYTMDYRIIRADGTERLVCERTEFVFDSTGQASHLIGTVHDITERKQLEMQLRHAQKMDAIGQLAAGVAHDFNNVLTVIQGHASLLLDSVSGSENCELLQQVMAAADRGANLTRQLLLFSRKQAMQTRPVDLNEITRQMTKMLGRILHEDILLVFDHSPSLPVVEAEPGMLEQVLINLAVNARDAMPRGGKLIITTAEVRIGEAEIELNPEAHLGNFVRLTVADTGAGIPAAILPRIFEPFFTTKPMGKGTGLGLSTVYAIVKQHKGWVQVSSNVERGTRFDIFLPVASAALEGTFEDMPTPIMRGGTEQILVVEDEMAVRKLACRVLRRYGYRILECESGAAALPIWEENWEKIDLLLTDLVMPGGLSGRELAERCLSRKPDLKVVYTSGYSPDALTLKASTRQGMRFLGKPYHVHALAQIVRDCLDQH